MCGTCGCSNNDGISMTVPGNEKMVKEHNQDHHMHHDDNHHHEHHHHTHESTHSKVIRIEQDILRANDLLAERNKGYFEAKEIFSCNMVSSPGSGKTSLLERTLKELKSEQSFYVIEGDQQTMNDANRIDAVGVPVIQINTGKACHLDAEMINRALKELKPADNSVLFIENVGNLVCPAMFKLGEHKRIVIISVTEGDDKAIKYPDMFHGSDLCIINKIDLLPYVDFNVQKAKEFALRVNHHLDIIELSAKSGEGMAKWYDWLSKCKDELYHTSVEFS